MTPITIPSKGPQPSGASTFFNKTSPPRSEREPSKLLKSVRSALRGSPSTDPPPAFRYSLSLTVEDLLGEDELSWDENMVVISMGGVQRKKWSFQEEGQSVQWACWAWLEQPGMVLSNMPSGPAHYTSDALRGPSLASDPCDRPTFGPFARAQQARRRKVEPGSRTRCIFVFLRGIGKIYLMNGLDYTFSLPFIVRKAWPLAPHGVLIQRVLDTAEIDEARITGEFTLPTLFTMTNPFAEAKAVGLTEGILGGFQSTPPSLKDEDTNCKRPLRSIPADEHVIWVSERGPDASDDLVVTLDAERRHFSVWRYVYIKPKDSPLSLGRPRARSDAKKGPDAQDSLFQNRRHSATARDLADRADRIVPPSPDLFEESRTSEEPILPPLSALPGMAPSLSTTTTLASLVSGPATQSQKHDRPRERRNSLTRNELSVTMKKLVLGGRLEPETTMLPVEHGRMKAAFWMERLYTQEINEIDSRSWRKISVSVFDSRWDGKLDRSLLGVCLPGRKMLFVFGVTKQSAHAVKIEPYEEVPAIAIVPIHATRHNLWDALILKPDHSLALLTHGTREIPLQLDTHHRNDSPVMELDGDVDGDLSMASIIDRTKIVALTDPVYGSVTIVFEDGSKTRTTIDLVPDDNLTSRCFLVLAVTLPAQEMFTVHHRFLELWSSRQFLTAEGVQFDCLEQALLEMLNLIHVPLAAVEHIISPWDAVSRSKSHMRLSEDVALRALKLPHKAATSTVSSFSGPPHALLAPILNVLHALAEDFRLVVHCHHMLFRLVPVICRIARVIRPEWADYWKRLCPSAVVDWPSPSSTNVRHLDDRLPVWPPDISATLYGRINNPEWKVSWFEPSRAALQFNISPSFVCGLLDGLSCSRHLTAIYGCLADSNVKETRKRAENTIQTMVRLGAGSDILNALSLGIVAPLREAARTCQLNPPGDWPVHAYQLVGRNDLAEGASAPSDILFNDGYRSMKDYLDPQRVRKSIGDLVDKVNSVITSDTDNISGIELDLEEFTEIRFGQDRRLQEVARMLCSSAVPSIKMLERPELNEHDQAKEQQNQVIRTSERTVALPLGRAMFTFGSVPTVTREAYVVPKIEYSIRIQPQNVLIAPEAGKITVESINWAEFHNGVAAGVRISPSSSAIESSWIAFNKPSELTSQHAGFLFGLGLTGHLKEMLTWHTFAYLTPKHDLTSIGVLLGLAAANAGTGNRHVTKLLAVHTPALLPTPSVDLNVPLLTQAAGLVGVGLLYMGTKNRRMAEVCLGQISRTDLSQPDFGNEHREAYTTAAALAFGMVMLGKGSVSSSPADMALLSRLRVLIRGEPPSFLQGGPRPPSFDINLTSPAASIALGLMYLKTERQDVADIMTIPDTVLALNQVQPSFLLLRTVARALIMWDKITPSADWFSTQIPVPIAKAIESRMHGKAMNDALELAYYNILAGCCFAVALKFAGTAREEAYLLLIGYYDLFSRLAYTNGIIFDQKIKRSAVRDGLNLISLSLNMVMAGTGEINCLRRLRYAHGMYNQPIRYGSHLATHMSLGLLFLGGGRFTLGTSDAAIACMVAAFFPRFPAMSSDNKSHLQALRHLWVLAVEPRCLIARDVDTREVVYLPVKIKVKEGKETGGTQLISPTLIPDLDKLLAIRVDTPRYWPFYLDIANLPGHREALLRSQTLYVKRRTAFLSYMEDPKGSRSLFVRSGSSTGDAATLDFPQLCTTRAHPSSDLSQFITSFSNDALFVSFADRFCREDGQTHDEKVFHAYCHASLFDSILQDKPQTLQTHLSLYRYRTMPMTSRYFNLMLQDLRFAAEFYGKVYDRRFSGRLENNWRPPLVREGTVAGVLFARDIELSKLRLDPRFLAALARYVRGKEVPSILDVERMLATYLVRNSVPVSTVLVVLKELARQSHKQCLGRPAPEGTVDSEGLDRGIKAVLHAAGTQMTTGLGSGWTLQSMNDIVEAWKDL